MFPVAMCLAKSELVETFVPSIALSAILAVVIVFAAILALVTCKSPICIVSILPLTNSAESTAFAAISEAPTAPTFILDEPIELAAICGPVTALSAICIVSILPLTSSELSIEFSAICAELTLLIPTLELFTIAVQPMLACAEHW